MSISIDGSRCDGRQRVVNSLVPQIEAPCEDQFSVQKVRWQPRYTLRLRSLFLDTANGGALETPVKPLAGGPEAVP